MPRLRSLSWLAASLALSVPAMAAEPGPDCPEKDATVCGRKHFERGGEAFEKGDYPLSALEFEAALAQRPHPVIRFNLALAFSRLGRPTAAIAELRRVQSDPAADQELRARAAREQKSAELALARVTFRLADPSRERVELDGERVSLTAAGEVSLDPGTHHVRVVSNASIVLDQDLDLAPGERVELRVGERSRRIDVVVVPEAAPTTPAPAPAPVAPVPASSAKLPATWFFVGVGATAVLTGLTLWSGLDTQSAFHDYERDLPQLTRAEADARVTDGHSRELRTNLLLAGTLVAGAGTAVLGVWFTDFSGKPRAAVNFAPGALVVSGRF